MSLKGHIKDLSLVDLLQVFHNEKKTLTIHLGSENGYGKVYLMAGNVVHSTLRNLVGKEAFHELLKWHDGDFEVSQGETSAEITITDQYEHLILDGLRQIDEANKSDSTNKSSSLTVTDKDSMDLITTLLSEGILKKAAN